MENDENYYCDKEVKIYNSFDDMELPDNLLRGVYGKGWEKPSPIQARAVVLMKDGHEIIAQSQSGTVKQEHLQLVLLHKLIRLKRILKY